VLGLCLKFLEFIFLLRVDETQRTSQLQAVTSCSFVNRQELGGLTFLTTSPE